MYRIPVTHRRHGCWLPVSPAGPAGAPPCPPPAGGRTPRGLRPELPHLSSRGSGRSGHRLLLRGTAAGGGGQPDAEEGGDRSAGNRGSGAGAAVGKTGIEGRGVSGRPASWGRGPRPGAPAGGPPALCRAAASYRPWSGRQRSPRGGPDTESPRGVDRRVGTSGFFLTSGGRPLSREDGGPPRERWRCRGDRAASSRLAAALVSHRRYEPAEERVRAALSRRAAGSPMRLCRSKHRPGEGKGPPARRLRSGPHRPERGVPGALLRLSPADRASEPFLPWEYPV